MGHSDDRPRMIFDEETAAIRESLRRGRLLADLGSEWRELKAGTFYGLLLDHRISAEEAARIVDVWREHGPDSKLIVLDAGMQIEELDDDRLRELGLFAHRGVLMGQSGVWFRFRLWLSDGLLNLGVWVQPEHRYNHAYSDDGETITIWREPVCRP